jgi:CAAX protease family protein
MSGLPKMIEPDASADPAPPRASLAEIGLVLGVPTLLFLGQSFFILSRGTGQVSFTDARLLRLMVEEAVIAALLLPYLRRRGWTPDAIAGAPAPMDILRGALLWLGSYAAYYVVVLTQFAFVASSRAALLDHQIRGSVSLLVGMAASITNPIFEEFLWLGYSIPALKARIGLRNACLVSIGLRTMIHVYQGPHALPGLAAIAVVITWYYARTGRLWPVVVAHVIADSIGLAALRP